MNNKTKIIKVSLAVSVALGVGFVCFDTYIPTAIVEVTNGIVTDYTQEDWNNFLTLGFYRKKYSFR